MSVWTFATAAFLSLPKQFATVYIGVIIGVNGQSTFRILISLAWANDFAEETTPQRIASYTVIIITVGITIAAARYILRLLKLAKPEVIYERRKARFVPRPCPLFTPSSQCYRQAKIELGSSYYNNNDSTLSTFNPNPSDSDIPLQPYDPESEAGYGGGPSHQQWDESGHAVGYAPDPRLHAPRPRAPSFSPTALYTSPSAAAATTASQHADADPDAEDEWTNAQPPNTARLPEPPAIRAKSPTSAPPLNSEAQYASFNPDHFAENVAAVTAPAHQHTYAATAPFGASSPPPPRALSPPPGYR